MHGINPWDFRITVDLFLGGLGIGIFLYSVILSFVNKERYERIIKLSAYLTPILVGGGLLFLISELGRPERFLTTMYNFNSQSVTSWGGLFQGIFILISLVYAFMFFRKSTSGALFKALQIFGSIFAVGVGVYHGLLLASLGRPLWTGGLVPVMFLVSSILGGLVLILILKSFALPLTVSKTAQAETAAAGESGKEVNFNAHLFLLTGLQLILVLIWQVSLYRSGTETLETVNKMMAEFGTLWWLLVIVIGLLIPFAGSIYQLVKDHKAEMSNSMAIILSLLVLIGSVTFKYIILTVGQFDIPFFL